MSSLSSPDQSSAFTVVQVVSLFVLNFSYLLRPSPLKFFSVNFWNYYLRPHNPETFSPAHGHWINKQWLLCFNCQTSGFHAILSRVFMAEKVWVTRLFALGETLAERVALQYSPNISFLYWVSVHAESWKLSSPLVHDIRLKPDLWF